MLLHCVCNLTVSKMKCKISFKKLVFIFLVTLTPNARFPSCCLICVGRMPL